MPLINDPRPATKRPKHLDPNLELNWWQHARAEVLGHFWPIYDTYAEQLAELSRLRSVWLITWGYGLGLAIALFQEHPAAAVPLFVIAGILADTIWRNWR